MYQIKIFNQENNNQPYDLQKSQVVRLGKNFQCDLFLNLDDVNDFIEIKTIENKVIFHHLPVNSQLANQALIKLNQEYHLPIFFTTQTLQIGIGSKEDLDNWVQENNNNKLNSLHENLITFDDSGGVSKFNRFYDFWFKSSYYIKNIREWAVSYYKQKPQKFIIIASCTLFAVISLFFGLALIHNNLQTSFNEAQLNQTTTNLQRVFVKLNKYYPGLWLYANNNGGFDLNGVVDNNTALNYINRYMFKYHKLLNINIYVKQDLINTINLIIVTSLPAYKIIANYDEKTQQVFLTGVIDDLNKLDDLEIKINNQLPGLHEISVASVYELSQINNDINKLIGDYPESENIKLINKLANKWSLTINGYMLASDINKFNDNLNQFKQSYPILIITSNLQDVFAALPFKIETIYSGEPSYIELDNGNKVFIGGEIVGFKIANITNEYVSLKGKINIRIPLESILNSTNNQIKTRQDIIENELTKEKHSVNEESEYLQELESFRPKVNDIKMQTFINKQIASINQDLIVKKRELNAYTQSPRKLRFLISDAVYK